MKRTDRKLREIAVHEAGHAVVIVLQGGRFAFVEIVEAPHLMHDGIEGTRAGRVHYNLDDDITDDDLIRVLWGGVCATKIFKPYRSWMLVIVNGGNEDISQAGIIMDRLGLGGCAVSERIYQRQTTQLLKENWPLVMAVADELFDRKRLTYDEVIDIWKPTEKPRLPDRKAILAAAAG